MSRREGRIVVDATKCDGHGICVLRCPDLLSLDTWGYVGVENTGPLTGTALRRARSAAAACPERALAIVEVRDSGSHRKSDVVSAAGPERAHSSTWHTAGGRTRS